MSKSTTKTKKKRGTRPGLTREESRQLTRSRLLTAGRSVFAEHGLQGANLTEILERAGVSPGAFYHHFGDKLELFLAILDEISLMMRRMLRESRNHLRNPGEDLLAWVADLYRRALELARSDHELFLIFQREVNSGNPRLKAYFERDRAAFRHEVEESLDDLVERGFLPEIDTRWAAYVIAVFSLSVVLEQLGRRDAGGDTWCLAMARMTLGGVPGLGAFDSPPPGDRGDF